LKIVRPLAAAALLLFSALPAIPEQRQKILSSTRTFFIDGQRYLVEKSTGGDLSLIRRQLARQGWDLPVPFSGDIRQENSFYADSLRMEGNAAAPQPSLPIPVGLHAEHILRMESDSGPLDLAAGSMNANLPFVRTRMRESGWIFNEAGQDRERLSLATQKKGRETFLVLLDEKKRKFLLARRME
jgi:hypothetical protein